MVFGDTSELIYISGVLDLFPPMLRPEENFAIEVNLPWDGMEDATACAAQRNGHAENPPESVPRGRRGLQLQATPSLLRRAAC